MLARMSDFDQPAGFPPAPPASPPQAPFGVPGAPPPAPGYAQPGYTQPGYGQPGSLPPAYAPMSAMPGQKPPRPAVTVGSVLLVVGGVLLILGSFLNWFTIDGQKFTGFSGDEGDTKDGPVFVFLGVVALGFGVAQLMAKKILAVAILAVVFASFALLAALADIGDVGDVIDLADAFGVEASRGPGLWIILVGSAIALAGGITTLAKRRK